jgi:hypothetical protein
LTKLLRPSARVPEGGAHGILRGLRDRGRITWKDRLKRSIVLLPSDRAIHRLPPDLQAKLERYCNDHDERPGDVLADALALHFDAIDGHPPTMAEAQ